MQSKLKLVCLKDEAYNAVWTQAGLFKVWLEAYNAVQTQPGLFKRCSLQCSPNSNWFV